MTRLGRLTVAVMGILLAGCGGQPDAPETSVAPVSNETDTQSSPSVSSTSDQTRAAPAATQTPVTEPSANQIAGQTAVSEAPVTPVPEATSSDGSDEESAGGVTPAVNIHEAAGAGDLERVKQYIASGGDLNKKEPRGGNTALSLAALLGHAEVAVALIDAGAEVDIPNNEGDTSLSTAAFLCHEEIVQALLAKGADVNRKNNKGESMVVIASLPWPAVKPVYDIVGRLLEMELDYQRLQSTRPKIAAMLREHAGETQTGAVGGTSTVNIHEAAGSGDLERVKQYIASGGDLNQKEPSGGNTALRLAALLGHAEVAVALIDAGAEVDIPDNDGTTALSTAAFFCHEEIVQALLAKGADVNRKNNNGDSAMTSASLPWPAVKPIYDLVGALLEMKLDYQRLQSTRPKIAAMLREHAGETQTGAAGGTLGVNIHEAAGAGDLERVKQYIASGGDLNKKEGRERNTALLMAALFGHKEVVFAMIDAGAEVDIPNNDGDTALSMAAFLCHEEIVEVLLAKGADANRKNKKGDNLIAVASLPWPVVKPIYDLMGPLLGLKLDNQRLQSTRPKIAAMLREHAGKAQTESVNEAPPSGPNRADLWDGIWEAASTGDVTAVNRHVEAGVDLDARETNGGNTPLNVAAMYGQRDAVAAIIKQDVDINLQNNDGNTALHLAAGFGHRDIVELLLKNEADIYLQNKKGEDVLKVVSPAWSKEMEAQYRVLGVSMGMKLDLKSIRIARPKITAAIRKHWRKIRSSKQ